MGIDHHRIKILPTEILNKLTIWFIRVFRRVQRFLSNADTAFMLIEHPVILPFVINAKREFSLSVDFVRPGEDFSEYRKIIIPNGLWDSVAEATNAIPAEKRVYCEIGFLPQTKNVYFDPLGVHGHSSIRSAELPILTADDTAQLARSRETFRQQNFVRVKWDSVDLSQHSASSSPNDYGSDFYFVPLQLTRDTAFELCPFDTNQAIINYVQDALPESRLIFKTHPLDTHPSYSVDTRNTLLYPDNKDLRELLLQCRAVIASNSTVILEALMLQKKCATYGAGFTTNHHVTLECHEELSNLASIEQWEPDWQKVDRFLWLLLNRQVSVGFRKDPVERDKLKRIFQELDVIQNDKARLRKPQTPSGKQR